MPGISGLFKSDPNQPEFAALLRRDTAGDPRGCTLAARKMVNFHAQSGFERSLAANPAALGIHQDGVAIFREVSGRVNAADAQRNLDAHPRPEAFLDSGGQGILFLADFSRGNEPAYPATSHSPNQSNA
jgi:hypothetical protein